jgi:hypothetical protein
MTKLVAVGASRWSSHEEPEGVGDESGTDARKNWSVQVEARLSVAVKVGVRSEQIAREGDHPGVPQRLPGGAEEARREAAAEEPINW